MQPRIKIWRRFGRLPLIQQRHGLTEFFQLAGAVCAGAQMIVEAGRRGGESGGQVRKQFTNFCALHCVSLSPLLLASFAPSLRPLRLRAFNRKVREGLAKFAKEAQTNSFSSCLSVSYARNRSDFVADSLNFKTSAIW